MIQDLVGLTPGKRRTCATAAIQLEHTAFTQIQPAHCPLARFLRIPGDFAAEFSAIQNLRFPGVFASKSSRRNILSFTEYTIFFPVGLGLMPVRQFFAPQSGCLRFPGIFGLKSCRGKHVSNICAIPRIVD